MQKIICIYSLNAYFNPNSKFCILKLIAKFSKKDNLRFRQFPYNDSDTYSIIFII